MDSAPFYAQLRRARGDSRFDFVTVQLRHNRFRIIRISALLKVTLCVVGTCTHVIQNDKMFGVFPATSQRYARTF